MSKVQVLWKLASSTDLPAWFICHTNRTNVERNFITSLKTQDISKLGELFKEDLRLKNFFVVLRYI